MSATPLPRETVMEVVAAHGALTSAVTQTARLMAAGGYGQYAEHLDNHRAELNVAIGEFALWVESFGIWAQLDLTNQMHPPVVGAADAPPPGALDDALLNARETLKAERANLLSSLAQARAALNAVGLPADELTAYRRLVRLWAGEAIDVVAAVHRLTLADRYIRHLAHLSGRRDDALHQKAANLLHEWMHRLEEVDREGELALAESCGYGSLVDFYRARM
ncbi:hypothetical protein J3E61_000826 [Mycobacterium sp. OAE908]|uniref:hypothetical protein n=1 Tax=Mycobacterium sp. OAE908 TaxID=2817899 RepID=UPI0034E2D79F